MLRTALLAAAIGLCSLSTAQAQSRSLSGGSANGGTLSAGSRTLTGGGSSGGSTSGGTSQEAQNDAGSLSGSERFLRENRQGAFVGADNSDSTQMRSQQADTGAGRGGQTGRGGRDAGADFLSQFAEQQFRASNQNSMGSSSQPVMRRTIAVDFAFPAASEERTETALNARLVEVSSLRRFAGALTVHVAGRTAVIEGVVANDRDRRLAENLLRLEPGVSRVDNRIVVGSDLPAPTAQ